MRTNSHMKILTRVAALLAVILCMGVPLAQVAAAQTGGIWSPPVNISADVLAGSSQVSPAIIAADAQGAVHVAWPECSVAEEACAADTIYYSVMREGAWSFPVDILAAPVGEQVTAQALDVDPYGRLILAWTGNRGLNISIAEAASAGSARAWTTTTLAPGEAVRTADLSVEHAGKLALVFTANDRDLLYSTSQDAGATWSEPVVVHDETRNDAALIAPRLAAGRDATVYVCWTMTSEATSWGAVGVQFANSPDGGATWSPPQTLAEGSGYGYCALLVDSEALLHIFWLGSGGIGGRYHRWSKDEGITWSDPIVVMRPEEVSGFPGSPTLLLDSAGNVNVVFAGLGSSGEEIWHSVWDGNTWRQPIPISGDLPDSQVASATIGLGHQIHAVWLEYGSKDQWAASYETGSPAVQVDVMPLPEASTPTPRPAAPAPPAEPTSAVTALDLNSQTPTTSASSPQRSIPEGMVLVLAVAPAVLLVVIVVLYKVRRR